MSIEAVGISKVFGTQKALAEVSFDVKKGEIVGFLGPNGAGKSTMMRIISGFIPPTEGHVMVCGLNIEKHEKEVKSRLGYLPENNPLYYEMYVKEYLEFVAQLYGIKDRKKQVEDMIDRVGLSREKHKKIGALSKGYKQRVGLAQAFVHNPDVLILDEATTGLDPNQIVEIRSLIREIGKDKTVLLSTHIMQEVEAICDRAIIINNGKIAANADIASLKKLRNDEGKVIVAFSRKPDSSIISSHFSSIKWQQAGDGSFEFQSKDVQGLRRMIMQFCLENQLEIVSMAEASDNLERVFRDLTGNTE